MQIQSIKSYYLSKLEDGITPIEITEFVRIILRMNSVMHVTIFQIAHSLNKIEISTYQSITTVDQLFQNINYCFLPKRNQQKSSCLIYVICVCLCRVVSNTYCVVFLLCFCLRLVYLVFSGLSNCDCPFGIIKRLFAQYCRD